MSNLSFSRYLAAGILLLSFIILSSPAAHAQATLSVNPISQNISFHSNKTLSINISVSVTGLYGYQYDIRYNQSILNLSGIVEGSFLKSGGVQTLCIAPNTSAQGLIRNIACTRTGGASASGQGNTTTITFNVSQNIIPPLATQIGLVNTKLSDINSQPIAHSVVNGTININVCLNGETSACGSNIGECRSGIQTCANYNWGSCQGGVGPAAETCDGKDNDCDSFIDEGLTGCLTPITVTTNYYDGSTTNFSALNLSNNVTGMVLEKLIYGKIVFRDNVRFTQSVNLDYNTNISFNRIFINSTAFPMLNKPATLSLYNIAFTNPVLYRDGSQCLSDVCTLVSYSGGVLIFNVTGFSEYYAVQGAYCGDGSCSGSESCSSCPQDCGSCPPPPGGGGGGGSPACTNGQTRACSLYHSGVCAAGTETCVSGNWTGCPAASSEACNHLDDNCNGLVDDSLTCTCYLGESRPCGSNVGECNEGTRHCDSLGSWGQCSGETGPSAELCNGLDDDCNGLVDDSCLPPAGTPPCQDGIIPESGCMCGDRAYTTGYCYSGVYSEQSAPEFPWITLAIFGVIMILLLTAFIIYKEFHKKGKKDMTWEELLDKYRKS